ncbi:MAG: hypothetical protein OJI67_13010 [Prosthecobacter sp.]|nr:hypothetical protein [Prosthecobacter sp.]
MKLKNRIACSILFLVFAAAQLAPAATIPQLKSPPKVPTVKVPKVAKVPQVKVPSVKLPKVAKVPQVKVPAVKVVKAPAVKVPVVSKVPTVKAPEAPKVPEVAKIAKVPNTPKVPKTPKFAKIAAIKPAKIKEATSAVKSPKAPKNVTTADKVVDSAKVSKISEVSINTGKLRNLKENIQVDAAVTAGRGEQFVQDNFGSGGFSKPGNLMDGLKGKAGNRSKNPLPSKADQMIPGKTGQLSDDPSEETTVLEDVQNFVSSVVGSILSGAGTKSAPGSAASGTAGSATGAALTILTANTGSPEDKKNEANGIIGLFRQGKKGTSNANADEMMDQVEKTPLPDDMKPSSNPVITKDTIRGIDARKNGAAEPIEEDSGSTGPINTGANGTGKLGSLAQPAGTDVETSTAVTAEDLRAIQVRIESKINTGGR